MKEIVAVALGGAVGSVLRFIVANAVGQSLGGAIGYGTLAVNVSGSLALGFLGRAFVPPAAASHVTFLALTVGLCGGYTTFSTFELDLFTMMERGDAARALTYVAASVVLSYAALALGYALARAARS